MTKFRNGAESLCAWVQIEGVPGLIILPDEWSQDVFNNCDEIEVDRWIELERAGAVFFPAAGNRYGTSVRGIGLFAVYWAATYHYLEEADYFSFDKCYVSADGSCQRFLGQSVRLVQDKE